MDSLVFFIDYYFETCIWSFFYDFFRWVFLSLWLLYLCYGNCNLRPSSLLFRDVYGHFFHQFFRWVSLSLWFVTLRYGRCILQLSSFSIIQRRAYCHSFMNCLDDYLYSCYLYLYVMVGVFITSSLSIILKRVYAPCYVNCSDEYLYSCFSLYSVSTSNTPSSVTIFEKSPVIVILIKFLRWSNVIYYQFL